MLSAPHSSPPGDFQTIWPQPLACSHQLHLAVQLLFLYHLLCRSQQGKDEHHVLIDKGASLTSSTWPCSSSITCGGSRGSEVISAGIAPRCLRSLVHRTPCRRQQQRRSPASCLQLPPGTSSPCHRHHSQQRLTCMRQCAQSKAHLLYKQASASARRRRVRACSSYPSTSSSQLASTPKAPALEASAWARRRL